MDEPASAPGANDDTPDADHGGDPGDQDGHDPAHLGEDWAHLGPSRWWFASAAFPMIAGTLGPVASAFSICSLVKPWRQSFPPGTDVEMAPYIDDPAWLTAINAVQLAVALFANMALFLNMTRRLSFTIAQPVTMAGWYLSALALISLLATAAGPLVVEPDNEFIWSQAFFYAIYSAVLYFFVASLMLVTYLGARTGRYPMDFMLTPSQRTLMLQTIMFLLYLLLGALLFCKIEHWNYLDALYWAAVTLFTVGFGDIVPNTPVGSALLMPYALVGIISLGLVIGSIRSLVLDRGKTRLGARIVEKKRRRTIRRLARTGRGDILVPIKDEGPTLSSVPSQSSALTEFDRREREFHLMRKIQDAAARRRRWVDMAVSTSTWLILWLAGARIFQACEARYQDWSYFDGFYFAFVSLTTIGYGDVTPISNAGRSFWVFWALLALPTTTVLISNAGDTIVKWIRDATDQIATVTILPSDAGFKKDWRRLLRMFSFGVLYADYVEPEPPSALGEPSRLRRALTSRRMHEGGVAAGAAAAAAAVVGISLPLDMSSSPDLEAAAPRSTSRHPSITLPPPSPHPSIPNPLTATATAHTNNTTTTTTTSQAPFTIPSPTLSRGPPPPTPPPLAVPTSRHDYQIALIDEICRVTQHLKLKPPRKYSFHEWAWYLRLLGEDEADAGRHAGAVAREGSKKKGGQGKGVGTRKGKRKGVLGGLLGGRRRRKGDGGEEKVGDEKGDGEKREDGEGEENREGGDGEGDGDNAMQQQLENEDGEEHDEDEEGGEEEDNEKQDQAGDEEEEEEEGDGTGETAPDDSPSNPNETNNNTAAAATTTATTNDADTNHDTNNNGNDNPPPGWSWVGSKSPLMGSQEEAEWILDRLIARLGDELRAMREGYH